MTSACRTACCLLLSAAMTTACQRGGPPTAGVLGDSTYVAAMAGLQRIHDERVRTPMPPVPIVPGPNGSAPTPEAQRRRDSVVRHRADSIVAVDSVKRLAIFSQYRVTVATLEATARALAGDPARLQRVNDAVYRRMTVLDAAANLAKTPGAKSGATATSPAPSAAAPAKP